MRTKQKQTAKKKTKSENKLQQNQNTKAIKNKLKQKIVSHLKLDFGDEEVGFSVEFSVSAVPAGVTDGGAEFVRLRVNEFLSQFLAADILGPDEDDRPDDVVLSDVVSCGMMAIIEVHLGLQESHFLVSQHDLLFLFDAVGGVLLRRRRVSTVFLLSSLLFAGATSLEAE